MASASDTELMCVRYFIEKLGWKDYMAAGLVGCMKAESGITPSKVNSGEKNGTLTTSGACNHGTAYGTKHSPWSYGAGICQWTYCDRKENAMIAGLGYTSSQAQSLIKSKGVESLSLEQQLRMAVGEISKGKYSSNYGIAMRKTQNLKDSVAATYCRYLGGFSSSASVPTDNDIKRIDKSYDAANGRAISGFGTRYKYANEILTKYRKSVSGGKPIEYDTSFTAPPLAASGISISGNQGIPSNANIQGPETDPTAEAKGIDPNMHRNKGTVYPLVRINDHFFTAEEIDEFYIETGYFKNYHEYKKIKIPKTGFIPTVKLVVTTASPDLLKRNQIKSGDKMAVFVSPGGGLVRSYRGDYIITSCISSQKPTEMMDQAITYIIKGELFVPNIHSEAEKTVINNTSRDALIEIAQKMGLGFFFCDEDNTNDFQGWSCTSSLGDFALDIAGHAWKDFNAFYDCWIDPRYGLTFLNMNKMLIEDGLDEPIDITPFVSTIINSLGVDGSKIDSDEETKKANPRPQAKILTNIAKEIESATPFYIKKWNIVNRAGEIANEIGINCTQSMNIDNPGVETQNTEIDMNYSIPINMTKLQNGFFVLIGPGVNLTYTQADQISSTMSFVKNSYSVRGGGINETFSNDDAQQIQQTGSNMMASGNVNRFYDTAWEHNMRNNLQLQKQYTDVECQGLNLAVMRGEKIPVIIMDHDKMFSAAHPGENTGSPLQRLIYESASGWYIIDGIMWRWCRDDSLRGSTYWTTKMHLVRREWPIPGRMAVPLTDDTQVLNTPTIDTTPAGNGNPELPQTRPQSAERVQGGSDTGYIPEGELDENAEEQLDEEDGAEAGGMPLSGLKSELVNVWRTLSEVTGNTVEIVSARRWAVDENGNRVDGNAFVKKNGLYKCINAKNEIMYFSSPNSRHLYGEAFDVINKQGASFQSITDALLDREMITAMLEAGVGAFIENTVDDLGTKSKHYHFGTDKVESKKFWDTFGPIASQKYPDLAGQILRFQSFNKNVYSSEITHATVEEK